MYADELYELFPSKFVKDKEFKNEIEKLTKLNWVSFQTIFDQVCDSILWWN